MFFLRAANAQGSRAQARARQHCGGVSLAGAPLAPLLCEALRGVLQKGAREGAEMQRFGLCVEPFLSYCRNFHGD